MAETASDELLADLEEAMRDVVDPELGINVVDLGLVYGLSLEQATEGDQGGSGSCTVAVIDMTLTSAACPLIDVIEDQTLNALVGAGLVEQVRINWVWNPPWGPDKITDDGREMLRALGFNIGARTARSRSRAIASNAGWRTSRVATAVRTSPAPRRASPLPVRTARRRAAPPSPMTASGCSSSAEAASPSAVTKGASSLHIPAARGTSRHGRRRAAGRSSVTRGVGPTRRTSSSVRWRTSRPGTCRGARSTPSSSAGTSGCSTRCSTIPGWLIVASCPGAS